jgi:hypothetical protein
VQPAKDRIGTDGIRFSAAVARIWMRLVDVGGRRIRYARTQRHVRTPRIVPGNPRFQDAPEMIFAAMQPGCRSGLSHGRRDC